MIDFDTRAFAQELDRGVAQYERDGEKALDELGNKIVARAQSLVPTDTGRLRSSIRVVAKGRDAAGPHVDVGAEGVDYAVYVEYGTDDTTPQPYMRPALAEAPAQFGK